MVKTAPSPRRHSTSRWSVGSSEAMRSGPACTMKVLEEGRSLALVDGVEEMLSCHNMWRLRNGVPDTRLAEDDPQDVQSNQAVFKVDTSSCNGTYA